jgi:arylsulfatase A-like enzyme
MNRWRAGLAFGCGAAAVLIGLAAGRVVPERPALPALAVPSLPARIGAPPARPAGNPRNLVLISIDTLRADRLSLYGHRRATSPALDAFAADALVFESAWSASPKTAESHMTLFTGLYPGSHGVQNLRQESERLPEAVPTLASLLQGAGYRTVGFHGAGNLQGQLGFDRGFDTYLHPGGADRVFARGRAWLEAAREEGQAPFFLFLHTKVLHDPYDPPPEYAALFADPDYAGAIGLSEAERAAAKAEGGWWRLHERYWEEVDARDPADVQHLQDLYDALIRYMDDQLGPFLTRFRELGFDRDTLLVFLSDHGEEFLDHRGFRHGSVYREVLHVPLVMRLPGGGGARIPERVALVDVLPTLLEWLELPVPEHVQGRSFAPLLAGEDIPPRPLYSEWTARGVRALHLGDWKYVDRRVRQELYDLSADPDEHRDLLRRRPDVAERLRADTERMSRATAALGEALGERERFDLDPRTRDQLEALGYLGGGN